MRRYLAAGVLAILVGQSSGLALALSPGGLKATPFDFSSTVRPIVSAIMGSQIVAQLSGNGDRYAATHRPKPVFAERAALRQAIDDNVSKSRLARIELRHGQPGLMRYPSAPPRTRTRDPLAVRSTMQHGGPSRRPNSRPAPVASRGGSQMLGAHGTPILGQMPAPATGQRLGGRPTAQNAPNHERMGQQVLASTDLGAGINRYWEYEERAIPGIGKAMLNVGNGNLLIQAADVAIPERGLGLVFQRTYNSQSLHDANGDDGGEPNIFGNGWTNTYDAHIVYQPTTGDISVYDIDGTRCDYTPNGGAWVPCAGEHAILEVDPSDACAYWWIKKNGTAYWFHTDDPGPGCNFGQGKTGRLYKIVGRNSNNAITLSYSFSGSQTTQDITEIDVNHSDGQSLTMLFGWVGGTPGSPAPPNELASIQYANPGGSQSLAITYSYDTQGDLQQVDRPGNDKVTSPDPLPETYGLQHPMQFACGPRATNYKQGVTTFADGSCLNFDYDSNIRLTDWKVNGSLNINPSNFSQQDTFGVLQPGQLTGWQTWYMASFVYGAGQGTACGTTSAGTTTMCDSDGHATIWSTNSLAEVTQTSDYVNAGLSLVTSQAWDTGNNLVQFVDANNHTTNYAYDQNGNTIAVSHPAASLGASHPTEIYAYDPHNNLTAYCDPVYANNNGLNWNSGSWPGTQCPGGAGTTHYTWATPSPEPYGQLTDAYTACYQASCTDNFEGVNEPGYHVTYSYNSNGEPTIVQAANAISQPTQSRTPIQSFTYDTYGNLKTYTNGDTGTWNLYYDSLNRLTSRVDPDTGNPTSYFYYYNDGSMQMSETPYQHSQSKGHTYSYDADGDVISDTAHRSRGAATIQKLYDGLDRLVEVIEPQDTISDVFQNAWITRYLYDLSEGGTVTFDKSSPFSAYGNLFETQESLPSSTTLSYSGSPLNNSQVEPQKGAQYDALDRPVGAYSIVNGADALTSSTYDGHGEYGLLTHQCKPDPSGGQNQLCKTFYHDNDNRLGSVQYSDGSSRNFTYDIAGHELTAAKSGDDQYTYWYDLEGRVVNTKEPNIGTSASSQYTHVFYADGKLKQLDVSSSLLNKVGLFVYSYDDSGRLTNQSVSYSPANVNVNIAFTYTLSGRPKTKTESSTSPLYTDQTQWGYDQYGQLDSTTYPGQGAISDYQYDPEGDLLQFNGSTYTYTIRGELLAPNLGYSPLWGFPAQFSLANGAQVQGIIGKAFTSQWDARMGVMKQLESDPGYIDESSMTYSYDAVGRDTSESSDSCTGQCQNNTVTTTGTTRTYDIDDHTLDTKQWWVKVAPSNGGDSSNVSVYDWGPADHPIRIGSANGASQTPPNDSSAAYDTLHWDGDQLIFSTNPQRTLDDIKVGTSADITFQGSGYTGITFWDRGPGGAVVYCHNATGSAGSGKIAQLPILMSWASSACFSQSNPPSVQYPTNVEWFTGPLQSLGAGGQPRSAGGVGQGSIVGEYRLDGISDGANTIQGIRTTSSNSGSWTTPDAFAGLISDPITMKSYMWNNDNPIGYSDPSGYYAQVFFDPEEGMGVGEAHADIDEPEEQDAVKKLVDRKDMTDFYDLDDAAYGAAYAYRGAAASLDSENGDSHSGIPEVGAGLYGNAPGHYSVGDLLFGYWDKDTNEPRIDITKTDDLAGFWHAHPRGSLSFDLAGHEKNLRDDPWLKNIYTSVGHDLFKQSINDQGIVSPAMTEHVPPIDPICKDCIP